MTIQSDNMGTKINRLVNLLKNHDWYFDYSDDANAWHRGNAAEKEIETLVLTLGQTGVNLYNDNAPREFKLRGMA
jgi:hypothetical protein